MIKRILTLLFVAFGFVASAQYTPSGSKIRFYNGLALSTRDTTGWGTADTVVMTMGKDSVPYYRYKGAWKSLIGSGGGGGGVPYTGATGSIFLGNNNYNNTAITSSSVKYSALNDGGGSLNLFSYGTSATGTTFGASNYSLSGITTSPANVSAFVIGTNNAIPLIFGQNGNEVMRLHYSTGHLLIGTVLDNTFGQLLQVNGGIYATSFTKSSGTSSQFLKADGSVDATSYQPAITLTTTGSSGASSFLSNTLNIPTYTLSGLGGVPTTTTVAGFALSGNVTLASHSVGVGLLGTAYNGSAAQSWTVDTAGTIVSKTFASNIYQPKISLTTTGSSGAATFTSNTLNVPTYTLAGLGGIGLTSLSSTATGLTYTNTTGVFSLTSGYTIPTTASLATYLTANQSITLSGHVTGTGTTAITTTSASKFILQGTTDATATGAQFLGALGTGILKNTTSTGVLSIATGADLPVMTATVGGAVPTPPNNTTTFLRGDGTFATPAGGGTVTSVSVTTANGVSGTVATATSTPAITLTLGAITPTSVNSVVLSGSTTPTLAVTGTSSISGANTGDVTLATNSGLGFTSGQTGLALGTPSSVTGSSTNSVTTNTHTHAVSGLTNANLSGSAGITVANGGTGVATITGIIKGNGTSAFSAAVSGTDYQAPITLTTTGTSGAATLVGSTLNIPNYATGGGGTTTNALTLNNSGTGAASGSTFNGSAAVTLSYNTIGAQQALTLTTTGSSGAATLASGALNIPTYTLAGLGGQPLATNLTSIGALANGSGALINNGTGTFSYGTPWTGLGYLTSSTGVTTFSAGTTGLTPSTATSGAITLAGTLAVANGGTGATTITGLVKGNGTSAFSAAVAGTDYQAVINGTGFVKATGTTISYDNSTYLTTATAASTYSPIAGSASITTLGTIASGSIPYSLITGTPSLTGYVPYTGATGAVNLGTNSLSAGAATFSANSRTYYTNASAAVSHYIDNGDPTGYSVLGLRNLGTTNKEYQLVVGGHTSGSPDNFFIYDATAAAARLIVNTSGAVTLGSTAGTGTGALYSGAITSSGSVSATDFREQGAGYITFDANNAGTGTLVIRSGLNGPALSFAANNAATFSSSVTASSLIKSGGTSSQFLMADGSVNTSVLTTGAYLPLAGGTLTGNLTLVPTTTSTQSLSFNVASASAYTSLLTTEPAGSFEVDNNAIPYFSHDVGARGVIEANQFISLGSAPYTLTSQTAAQKLFNSTANGQFNAKANNTYYFEGFFELTGMSTTSGTFGFALGGTSVVSSIHWVSSASKSALTTATTPYMTSNITTSNTALTAANLIATGYAYIKGIVRVTTAGTLIPQVSLSVASAAVVSVNSWFKITPAGTNAVNYMGNFN
jgi:hypothetical protein